MSSERGHSIVALLPRQPSGQQVVMYGDSSGHIHEATTELVNAVVARLSPQAIVGNDTLRPGVIVRT